MALKIYFLKNVIYFWQIIFKLHFFILLFNRVHCFILKLFDCYTSYVDNTLRIAYVITYMLVSQFNNLLTYLKYRCY